MYNLPMGREGTILRTGFNGRRIKSSVNDLNRGADPIQNLVCLGTKSVSVSLSLDEEAGRDQA